MTALICRVAQWVDCFTNNEPKSEGQQNPVNIFVAQESDVCYEPHLLRKV